jgi:hypothetical protein
MKTNKKGQVFAQLAQLATGIAILAIVLVVTFLIISEGRSQACEIEGLTNCAGNTSSITVNATNTLAGAVDDIPSWIPLIVIAVIGSILLGLVGMFKRFK